MSNGIALTVAGLVSVCPAVAGAQTAPPWPQLSLSTCRVDEFLAAHPRSDGRGVVIAVMDTGVDPSIPGLTRTPAGDVKVIDVQDFTGQGDVELHRVPRDGDRGPLVDHDEDGSPIHYALPALREDDSEARRFWMGMFDEKNFVNSDVPDLNDNGRTDDRFPVCVTALTGDGDDQAVCFVDTNLDRSFADETPLRNYKLDHATFTFHRERPERQIVPLTFAVNIFLRQQKVVVHYDDGAHGTHVAGIAAGYRINDQEGFNGVAPGAKLMSLKIGKNSVGGVSTTESIKGALEYAARFAREHDVPVVCNLSYGVESVIDGASDIDKAIDAILRKNPRLVFCTSAGNEGPGLSTVGTPAAATEAITVGAMLAPDTARDVMGMEMDHARVTTFSSRGGELAKPDIATPGWSTSTVPRWVKRGDFWRGTSMASPYAAGLCAVLISDAALRHPGAAVRAWDLRRALGHSAQPVPGATVLDAGHGRPDLPAAAEHLGGILSDSGDDPVIGYDISTPCPHGRDGTARAAYWRGTYFPTDEPQRFTIKPIFAPGTDASAKTSFARKFDLRSTSPWCRVTQQTVYLRSEQSARVFVEYDAEQLTESGLHVGLVEALSGGRSAFRLVNSVVVPYRLTTEENFSRSFRDETVRGYEPRRYFIAVPPGASAMKLTLSAPEGKESKASLEYVYDPTGRELRDRSARLNTETARRKVERTFTDDLVPGVWEIDVISNRPDRDWPYDLEVRFFGVYGDPPVVRSWSDGSGEVTVANQFERPLSTEADGRVEGFRTHKEDTFEGLDDELTYTVELGPLFRAIRVDLEMTPEAYATTTDIGVAVEDDKGNALLSDAFSNRKLTATLAHPSPGESSTLKVVIRGGFAVADDQRETPITVNLDRLLADPVPLKVTHGEASDVRLYPGVPVKLKYKPVRDVPAAPEGTDPLGYLRLRERHTHDEALRVPIDLSD